MVNSNNDTFVSMDDLAHTCSVPPSPAPTQSNATPSGIIAPSENTITGVETAEILAEGFVPSQPSEAGLTMNAVSNSDVNETSAFMWGLWVQEPEHTKETVSSQHYDIEAQSQYQEDLEDPSDVCGNFDTRSHTPSQASPQQPHLPEGTVDPQSEYVRHSYLKRIREAGLGMTSCEIDDPFYSDQNPENEMSREKIVLFSSDGTLQKEEIDLLQEMAEDKSSPQSKLLKRLLQTISFQRAEMEGVKDAEVHLADEILSTEMRRYSEVEGKRTVVIETLIEEVDKARAYTSQLELENNSLKDHLSEVQRQNQEVVRYYSGIVKDFDFSNGVFPALESVHGHLHEFRASREHLVETQKGTIDEYADRLYQMERMLFASRKDYEQLQLENEELKEHITTTESRQDSVSSTPKSAQRRFSTPEASFSQEKLEINRKVREQECEIETLRDLFEKTREDKKKVNEALLSLNLDLDEAKSKSVCLHEQRDSAERKCREQKQNFAQERERFVVLSNELKKTLLESDQVITTKESDLRIIRNELESRNIAYKSLQSSVQKLEEQLQNVSNAAVERTKALVSRSESATPDSQSVIHTVIDTLRKESSDARKLLKQRGKEIDELQRELAKKVELIIGLQGDCSKLRTAATIRRRTSGATRQSDAGLHVCEQEAVFLQRLSSKLGAFGSHGKDSNNLIESLSERVETLMKERVEFEKTNISLRKEVKERENALHGVRSEMQADISTLKAEVAHHENMRTRAQEERDSAEANLFRLFGQKDVTNGESMGDITSTSVGTRRWSIIDQEDLTGRRDSMFSSVAGGGDDAVRWNDPIIESAVQSLNALIGKKDGLAARNRELRTRLENLISSLIVNDDNIPHSTIIQTKEIQDEFTGIVDMQQEVIDKLGVIGGVSVLGLRNTEDDTLPLIQAERGDYGTILDADSYRNRNVLVDTTSQAASRSRRNTILRHELGETGRFLEEELSKSRDLYNEKVRVNAQLCEVLSDLEVEVEQLKAGRRDTEKTLANVQGSHDDFVGRLASLIGADKSAVAVEDFVRTALHDISRLKTEVMTKQAQEIKFVKRVTDLVAQKHVLSQIINIYQTKYNLNILGPANDEVISPRRRLRSVFLFVLARQRMTRKAGSEVCRLPSSEVDEYYSIPRLASIAKRRAPGISLLNATVALSAVPRLESAICSKDTEIQKLQSSLVMLNRSATQSTDTAIGMRSEARSAFVYDEDIMTRKNDISRRLRNAIEERNDLEGRLSREKQSRIAAEAKTSRYIDKVAILKKKLTKMSSQTESKERTYKAAIRYMKNKADKAVENDFNIDENVNPRTNRNFISGSSVADMKDNANNMSRSMLMTHISNAESDLLAAQPGSAAYNDIHRCLLGLRRALEGIEKPALYNPRVATPPNDNNPPVTS